MSIDYYLRLDLQRLPLLRLKHLDSQMDLEATEVVPHRTGEGARLAQAIRGYTEWLDAEGQGYSLGWDWHVQLLQGSTVVTPHSLRTNIMLTNPAGEDLGRSQTEASLETWLRTWDWSSSVWAALSAYQQVDAAP